VGPQGRGLPRPGLPTQGPPSLLSLFLRFRFRFRFLFVEVESDRPSRLTLMTRPATCTSTT
jgi:hypothetical protein